MIGDPSDPWTRFDDAYDAHWWESCSPARAPSSPAWPIRGWSTPPAEAREVCEVAGRGDVLAVANENAAKQIVLSGSIPAIERAEALARDRGAKALRLQVAGAFHSPLMQPALQRVRDVVSRAEFR